MFHIEPKQFKRNVRVCEKPNAIKTLPQKDISEKTGTPFGWGEGEELSVWGQMQMKGKK